MTNKCKSLKDLKKLRLFGFRGEALASISNISNVLSITSRPKGVQNTYQKIYRNKKWLPVEEVKCRPSHGTTVTIENFLYNLPVRQKGINKTLHMNLVKRNLESLAIIHPNVSFSLRDDSTNKIIMHSKSLRAVSLILCNFYPEIDINDLMKIKLRKNKIYISGILNKNGSNNNNLQFIYLNKRPIVSKKIQKLINSIVSKSTILDVNKFPVYVINISCSYSEIDLNKSKNTVEFKNWHIILDYIKMAVEELLQQQKLLIQDKVQNTNINNIEKKMEACVNELDVLQIRGAVKSHTFKKTKLSDADHQNGLLLNGGDNEKNKPNANSFDKLKNASLHLQESHHEILLPLSDSSFLNNNQSPQVLKKQTEEKKPESEHCVVVQRAENDVNCIFDKHHKTQSLVLNSDNEINLHNNLNYSISTNVLHNSEKGKKLIMDMFLKSTFVYSPEESSHRHIKNNLIMSVKLLSKNNTASKYFIQEFGQSLLYSKRTANNNRNKRMISKYIQTTTVRYKTNSILHKYINRKHDKMINNTFSKYFKQHYEENRLNNDTYLHFPLQFGFEPTNARNSLFIPNSCAIINNSTNKNFNHDHINNFSYYYNWRKTMNNPIKTKMKRMPTVCKVRTPLFMQNAKKHQNRYENDYYKKSYNLLSFLSEYPLNFDKTRDIYSGPQDYFQNVKFASNCNFRKPSFQEYFMNHQPINNHHVQNTNYNYTYNNGTYFSNIFTFVRLNNIYRLI